MPKRKATSGAPAEAGPVAVPLPSQETAKSPSAIRFPVLVISSFLLSFAGHHFASNFTEGDLAAVSRSTNEWSHIAGFLGGRVVELGLGWWGQYDGRSLEASGFRAELTIRRRRYGIFDIALTLAILPASQDLLWYPPHDYPQ